MPHSHSRKKLRILILAILAASVIIYIAMNDEAGIWLRRLAKNLLRELVRAF